MTDVHSGFTNLTVGFGAMCLFTILILAPTMDPTPRVESIILYSTIAYSIVYSMALIAYFKSQEG